MHIERGFINYQNEIGDISQNGEGIDKDKLRQIIETNLY
jgi:hypothetical protein